MGHELSRRRIIRIVVENVVFDLIVAGITSFTVSFPVMLALGALHAQWTHIPAFGWWTTYLLVVVWLLAMMPLLRRTRTHKLS